MDLRRYRIVGRNRIAIRWQHRTHLRHYVMQLVRVADNFPLSLSVREAYRDGGAIAAIKQLQHEKHLSLREAKDFFFQHAGHYKHNTGFDPHAAGAASEVNNG